MASCCDPNGLAGMFDERHARSKARRYRRHGLDAEARRIVEFVGERIVGRTVLEVGGGIGAIQLELLRRGASNAENVEISPGYEAVALDLATERGVADRIVRRVADFAVDNASASAADIVVLNRVVCCYPDMPALVGPPARLASEGDAFCPGAGVGWMRSMADRSRDENAADSRALAAMYRVLYELPMPLVARVQGAAIGGGAGLVAVADIAVASTAAFFAFAEVRVGILPAVVSPYVVRKVGAARATALFVTWARIEATRAHEIGLVERLAEPPELDAAVGRVVDAILEGSPAAVKAAKRLVREVEGRPPAEVADLTVSRIADIRGSGEGQEGLRAFLEKRKPRW